MQVPWRGSSAGLSGASPPVWVAQDAASSAVLTVAWKVLPSRKPSFTSQVGRARVRKNPRFYPIFIYFTAALPDCQLSAEPGTGWPAVTLGNKQPQRLTLPRGGTRSCSQSRPEKSQQPSLGRSLLIETKTPSWWLVSEPFITGAKIRPVGSCIPDLSLEQDKSLISNAYNF